MTMTLSRKRWQRLLYLGFTIILFFVLAMGISGMQPNPGKIVFAPLEDRVIEQRDTGIETTVTQYSVDRGSPWLYLFIAVGAVIGVYALIHSRQVRYGASALILFTALLLGAIYAYQKLYEPPEQDVTDLGDVYRPENARLSEELLNNPPDWLDNVSVAATAGVLLLLGVVTWGVWRIKRRVYPPFEMVAREAEATLADIRAGVELKDAVMRCYFDMSAALIRQRGLARQEGMTPREFEEVLVNAGLPQNSVQRLTRLFERVRYGGEEASDRDKREAVAALEEIIAVIRNRGGEDEGERPVDGLANAV